MLVGSSCKKLSGDCSTIKIVTDENDILYHYTNFGGFSGIIKSQKLWGTDIKYLNDAQELKYSAGLMAEIFHSLAQELPDLTEEERSAMCQVK